MKAKTVIAIVTGIAAEIVTTAILWAFTKMPLHDVVVWALVAYMVAVDAALWVTDKWKITVREIKKSEEPQIFNLRDYPEWREKEIKIRR